MFEAILAGKHANTFYQLTKTWNKHWFWRSLQYRLFRFHCSTRQTWYTHMLTNSHNYSAHIWHASKHWNYKPSITKSGPRSHGSLCVRFAHKNSKMLRCICPSLELVTWKYISTTISHKLSYRNTHTHTHKHMCLNKQS